MRNLAVKILDNGMVKSSMRTIYEDGDSELSAIEMKLTKRIHGIDDFTITIPRGSAADLQGINPIRTLCYIYLDNSEWWHGRLISVSMDVHQNVTLVFEGIIARLATTPLTEGLRRDWTGKKLYQVLNALVNTYNEGCATTEFSYAVVSYDTRFRETEVSLMNLENDASLYDVLEDLCSQLKKKYNLDFYPRCEGTDGSVVSINTATTSGTGYSDVITINMITDYEAISSAEPFANRIYCYSDRRNTADGYDMRFSLAGVPAFTDGDFIHPANKDYIEYNTSTEMIKDGMVRDCGVVSKTVFVEWADSENFVVASAKTLAKMKTVAIAQLTKAIKNLQSYSVSFVDDYVLGGDYSHYKIGTKVKFDGYGALPGFTAVITQRTYDLLNPLNDDIVVERSYKKLTDIIK